MQMVSFGDNFDEMSKLTKKYEKKYEKYFRMFSAEIFYQHAFPKSVFYPACIR